MIVAHSFILVRFAMGSTEFRFNRNDIVLCSFMIMLLKSLRINKTHGADWWLSWWFSIWSILFKTKPYHMLFCVHVHYKFVFVNHAHWFCFFAGFFFFTIIHLMLFFPRVFWWSTSERNRFSCMSCMCCMWIGSYYSIYRFGSCLVHKMYVIAIYTILLFFIYLSWNFFSKKFQHGFWTRVSIENGLLRCHPLHQI